MSKDQRRKSANASWIRTIIYGVLAFAVLVFYIKTSEVATLKQSVEICCNRGSYNPSGKCFEDSISIELYNRFNDNKKFIGLSKIVSEDVKSSEKYQKEGSIITRFYLKNDTHNVIKNYDVRYPHLFENIVIPDSGHSYYMMMVSSYIPSIFPFKEHLFADFKDLSFNVQNMYAAFKFASMTKTDKLGDFKIEGTKDYYGPHSFVVESYAGVYNLDTVSAKRIELSLPISSNVINNMNFFSAADLSQVSYELALYSDCPLKNLSIYFDVPVEMLPSMDQPDVVDAYCISFRDSTVLVGLNKNISTFHFRMPTQENLQIVRSLILTTLLTALLSIFFSNFYYACRKENLRSKRKQKNKYKRMSFTQAHNVYRYWVIPYRLFLLFVFAYIAYLAYRVLINKPIFMDYPDDIIPYAIAAFVFLLLFVLSIIYLWRYMRCHNSIESQKIIEENAKRNSEEEKKKQEEEALKAEEEEWNRMVEQVSKDINDPSFGIDTSSRGDNPMDIE